MTRRSWSGASGGSPWRLATLYTAIAAASEPDGSRGATPPVIFLLHKGYTPEYANFLMRLAAPVLMKPVRAADLRQAVERLVPAPRAASTVGS